MFTKFADSILASSRYRCQTWSSLIWQRGFDQCQKQPRSCGRRERPEVVCSGSWLRCTTRRKIACQLPYNELLKNRGDGIFTEPDQCSSDHRAGSIAIA